MPVPAESHRPSLRPAMREMLKSGADANGREQQAEPTSAPRASAASDSDSDSSSNSSSDSDFNVSESNSDASEGEAVRPGFVGRIVNAVKTKQHRLLEARRHPVIEWREAAQWRADDTAGRARVEAKQQRRDARAAAKAATHERREKRRAQQRVNRAKDVEFRALVQRYDDDLVKIVKRAELLTVFAVDARAKEKERLVESQRALHAKQTLAAALKIEELHREDAQIQAHAERNVQLAIETADELARRCGMLPAINSPVAAPLADQDETSSLLILRVNAVESAPLPTFQAAGSSSTPVVASSKMPTAAMTPPSSSPPAASLPPVKRLFFTVNLKRFKHTDEIRGEAIGDRGGVELARSLLTGACPRVKRIDLAWNGIAYAAVAALADCFMRGACGQLVTLDLRCNRIDARCLQMLLDAIAKDALPELFDLVLQGNTIGDAGAKALAHAMLSGTLLTLRRIDVRQNRIRNAGVQAIWHVFTSQCVQRNCPKLELLDVRRNDASSALTRTCCPCPPYLAL